MAATSFNEDFFMQSAADKEAWQKLSREFNWSEALLEKYRDKIAWKELSKNQNMLWTIAILHKYEKHLDWNELTDNLNEDILAGSTIEAFKEKWNWHALSGNGYCLTDEILQKYADKLDWSKITIEYNIEKPGIDFYNRYKDYLPNIESWWGSELWNKIVNQRKAQLTSEIQHKRTEDTDI